MRYSGAMSYFQYGNKNVPVIGVILMIADKFVCR